MDTSKEYIEMCEKAKKYLPELKPQGGQWWAIKGYRGWEVELACEGENWQEPYLRPWADYINDGVDGFDYESYRRCWEDLMLAWNYLIGNATLIGVASQRSPSPMTMQRGIWAIS